MRRLFATLASAVLLASLMVTVGASPAAAVQTDLDVTIDGGGPGSGSAWDLSALQRTTDAPGFNIYDAELDPDGLTPIGSQSDAFDSASMIKIDGTYVPADPPVGAADGSADVDGQYASVGPHSMSGLDVSIEYFIVPSAAVARNLTTLSNPTGSPITVTVQFDNNWGSDGGTISQGTSSGDTNLTTADRWYVTSDSAVDPPSDPANVTVFAGPGSPVATPTAISDTTFTSAGDEGLLVDYEVEVPAGETRRLMFFHEMTQTNSGALDAASDYNSNPSTGGPLIGDLTPAERFSIVNWQFDTTPPTVEVTGVADGETYVQGSVPVAGCSTTDAQSGVAVEATVAVTGGNANGTGMFTATCSGAVDNAGNAAGPVSVDYTVVPNPADEAFYVMVDETGTVYAFPGDRHVGNAALAPGATAVDVVINPDGTGYYVLDNTGVVHAIGAGSQNRGNLNLAVLAPGEVPVAMALTENGAGYWIFTNSGGAYPFGNAGDLGDVTDLPLVGAVVDAAPYPPGFYMAAADGGVFTPPEFIGSQEVPFFGSTYTQLGDVPLAQPIVTIYIDGTDGVGYSMAAGDGGMFNFDSEFCGSIPGILPGVTLNQPVVNAVPYGDCYIFFAADGGAFVFGDLPFLGSLGANPPPSPIVSGDAFATT